jgi:hypothetical protein
VILPRCQKQSWGKDLWGRWYSPQALARACAL